MQLIGAVSRTFEEANNDGSTDDEYDVGHRVRKRDTLLFKMGSKCFYHG